MCPKTYLDYFREFETTNEVFVAMPFAKEFQPRWKEAFVPAIREVGLKEYRVDVRMISDSIPIDILDGLGRAKLILVDTSFQKSTNRPSGPNANVMYELGIAQSIRLPEEVVVVVHDSKSVDESPFDISHIRFFDYDAINLKKTKVTIRRPLIEVCDAIDKTRDKIVKKIVKSLDPERMWFMGTIGNLETFDLYPFDPERKGLYGLGYKDIKENRLRYLVRELIDIGLLVGEDAGPLEKRIYGAASEYRVTSLGKVVWNNLPRWCKKFSSDDE